jgi:hypothetical protein
MADTATIKTMGENFELDQQLREHLEGLSAQELRQVASYVRKMAAGKEDPRRKPGSEGARWLVAQYVRGSGPYFYLQSYEPGDFTYTDERGRMRSGKRNTKYVGRRLPADLAGEFGYPEGATPEETGINVTGTPRTSESRESSKGGSKGKGSD